MILKQLQDAQCFRIGVRNINIITNTEDKLQKLDLGNRKSKDQELKFMILVITMKMLVPKDKI